MKNKHSPPGYTYTVSTAQIIEFRKIPVVFRLRKLEEMKRFAYMTAPQRSKELWDMFRNGKI